MPSHRNSLGFRKVIDATQLRLAFIFESKNFETNLDPNSVLQSGEPKSQFVIWREQQLGQIAGVIIVVSGLAEQVIRSLAIALERVCLCRVEMAHSKEIH